MLEDLEPEIDAKESAEKFKIIQHKANEYRLNKVWKKFIEAGFHPMLIKGWVTARKYPSPFERTFVDFDLVFSPDEFKNAEEFHKNNTFDYLVDLHNGVRHLDTLSFGELYERSEVVWFDDAEVRIPCEEDHLRIICVHWLNDGGEYKERLWDLYYAVANRKKDFDWDKCLSVVDEKRRRWIVCAIGVAHRYFDLDLSGTPIQEEVKQLPRWLIKTVEKQWKLNVRLIPLHQVTSNRADLWLQIKKRVPPNPIQATVELDGYFDKYPRVYYQVLDICKRIFPSFKRLKSQFGR